MVLCADDRLAGWLRQLTGHAVETRLASMRPSPSRPHAFTGADARGLGYGATEDGPPPGAADEATWEGEEGALGSTEVDQRASSGQDADGEEEEAHGEDDDDELDEEDRVVHDELRARARRRLQADWNLRM